MKTIILTLLFTSLSFSQSWFYLFDDETYNPLTDESGWALYFIGLVLNVTSITGDPTIFSITVRYVKAN